MWLRDSIVFSAPPRDVRIGLIPGANDAARQLRDAEQAAFERGRIEGERALSEQLVRQRAELVELHNGAIAALQRAVPQVIQHTEEAMIALAFEIAQKLVAEIPMTREMIGAAVREALQQVEDTTELNILLHP
jgi:flagellar biosynthesis/type III secretory pathway protein FliH